MIDFFTLMKLDNVKPDIKAPPKHKTLLHSLFKAIFNLYETLCRII